MEIRNTLKQGRTKLRGPDEAARIDMFSILMHLKMHMRAIRTTCATKQGYHLAFSDDVTQTNEVLFIVRIERGVAINVLNLDHVTKIWG